MFFKFKLKTKIYIYIYTSVHIIALGFKRFAPPLIPVEMLSLYSLVTECLRAKGLDDPLLCPDMDMSDPMLSDDCSLTALWCSVSDDPVNVDTGLPLLDTGLELTLASDTSSTNDLEPLLSRDNSNPNLVYSVSELQLLWFNVPRGFTVPPSSSAISLHHQRASDKWIIEIDIMTTITKTAENRMVCAQQSEQKCSCTCD